MVKTLADEYHGRKCHSATRNRSIHSLPSIFPPQWATKSLSEDAEDAEIDSLYIAGEINRAEWQLGRERNDKRMGR